MKDKKREGGYLAIEACVCVTIFLFLMLFLYSLFIIFEARNEMAHCLLQTCSSLSLDPVETGMDSTDNATQFLKQIYDNANNTGDDGFTTAIDWNNSKRTVEDETSWNGTMMAGEKSEENTFSEEDSPDEYGNTSVYSAELETVIRDRFVAYLAGGDPEEADAILNRYHIKNGLEGVSFRGSCVKDGNIYLVITYEIEYEWKVFDSLSDHTMQQSCCSRIWQ